MIPDSRTGVCRWRGATALVLALSVWTSITSVAAASADDGRSAAAPAARVAVITLRAAPVLRDGDPTSAGWMDPWLFGECVDAALKRGAETVVVEIDAPPVERRSTREEQAERAALQRLAQFVQAYDGTKCRMVAFVRKAGGDLSVLAFAFDEVWALPDAEWSVFQDARATVVRVTESILADEAWRAEMKSRLAAVGRAPELVDAFEEVKAELWWHEQLGFAATQPLAAVTGWQRLNDARSRWTLSGAEALRVGLVRGTVNTLGELVERLGGDAAEVVELEPAAERMREEVRTRAMAAGAALTDLRAALDALQAAIGTAGSKSSPLNGSSRKKQVEASRAERAASEALTKVRSAVGVVLRIDLPEAVRVQTKNHRLRDLPYEAIKASLREDMERLDEVARLLAHDEFGKASNAAGNLARRW